jgi:hypothetical protein
MTYCVIFVFYSPPYSGENCYFSTSTSESKNGGLRHEVHQTSYPAYFHTITIDFPHQHILSHLQDRPDLL